MNWELIYPQSQHNDSNMEVTQHKYQLQWEIDEFDTMYSLCRVKQKITSPESKPVDFFTTTDVSGDKGSVAEVNEKNENEEKYNLKSVSQNTFSNAGGEFSDGTSVYITKQLRQYTSRIMVFPKGIKTVSNNENDGKTMNTTNSPLLTVSHHSLVIGVQFRNQPFIELVSSDIEKKDHDGDMNRIDKDPTTLSPRVHTMFKEINEKYPPPTVVVGCTISLLKRREHMISDTNLCDCDETNSSSTPGNSHEQHEQLCNYDSVFTTTIHEVEDIILTRDITGAYTVPVSFKFDDFEAIMNEQAEENSAFQNSKVHEDDAKQKHTNTEVYPALFPNRGRYKLRILITAQCAKKETEILFNNVRTGLSSLASVMSAAFNGVGSPMPIRPVVEKLYKNKNKSNNSGNDSALISNHTEKKVTKEDALELDAGTHDNAIMSVSPFGSAKNAEREEISRGDGNENPIYAQAFPEVDTHSKEVPITATPNANLASTSTRQEQMREGKLDAYLTTLVDPPSGWSLSLWNLLLHVCCEVAAEEVEHSKLVDITTTGTHIGTIHPNSKSNWITEEKMEIWEARGLPSTSGMSSVFAACPPLRQRHREVTLSLLAQQALWGLTVDMVLSFSCLLVPKDRIKRLEALASMRASSPWAVAAVARLNATRKKQRAALEKKKRNGDDVEYNYCTGKDSAINTELFDICSFVFDPSEFFTGGTDVCDTDLEQHRSEKQNQMNSCASETPSMEEDETYDNDVCELDVLSGTKEQFRRSIVVLKKAVHDILDIIIRDPQHKPENDKCLGILSDRSTTEVNTSTNSTESNSTLRQLQRPQRTLRRALKNISSIEMTAVTKRTKLVERIKYIVEHGNWGPGAQQALSNAVSDSDLIKYADQKELSHDNYASKGNTPTSLSLISGCVRTGEFLLTQLEQLASSLS